MFTELLGNSIQGIGTSTITDTIFIGIIIIFFVALIKSRTKDSAFTTYAPTLMTSIGVFGTFLGIVCGLQEFQIDQIDESIKTLLDGLKTAFYTSLFGMGMSMIYKVIVSTGVHKKAQEQSRESIGFLDLYESMQEQNSTLSKMHLAIVGDSDTSLTTQLKTLRLDINDQQKIMSRALTSIDKRSKAQETKFDEFQLKLWTQMENFAEMLSKSATEQVIQALKEVIADFNRNLTEQFGENFKHLNEAVLKLVEWQENYKEQLLELEKQFKISVKGIVLSQRAISQIETEAKQIPISMEKLTPIIQTNQNQIEELNRHLLAFQDIKNNAVAALPEIQQQIDQTIQGMVEAKSSLIDSVSQSAQSIKQTTNDTQASVEQMVSNIKTNSFKMHLSFGKAAEVLEERMEQTRKSFEEGMKSISSEMSNNITEWSRQQSQENQKILSGMSSHADKALQDTAESVQKQVKVLDDSMSLEMSRVMTEMGLALASISNQFTKDYQELVSEMDKIVRYRGSKN